MDKTAAVALASRLKNTHGLGEHELIESVQHRQLNPYAGGDEAGWGVQVTRTDGQVLDVIGAERGGYQITSRLGGTKTLDRLVAEDLAAPTPEPEDEQSPRGDGDLVDRLTTMSAQLRVIDIELAAIRDELRLRSNR